MQMETLPPKYLKPIYITGKNTVVQGNASTLSQYQNIQTATTGAEFTTNTESFTTGAEAYTTGAESFATGAKYSTGAEFTTGAETTGTEFTTGAGSYSTGAEFSTGGQFTTGAESYSAGAEYNTGAQANTTGAEFTQSTFDVQPTYETTQTTTTTTSFATGASTGAQPVYKLLRRGAGISPNEQEGIVSTAMRIIQQGITPISNNTASGVKKRLGGDWLVIVYPQGKPIDFNMTCVQGNDYMYFTLDSTAFQVCRLR